jgi:hypothetical protein
MICRKTTPSKQMALHIVGLTRGLVTLTDLGLKECDDATNHCQYETHEKRENNGSETRISH